MERDRQFIILAALLNQTMYLAFIIIAGLAWNDHNAVVTAIAAFGLTFLGYAFQALPLRIPAIVFCALSWLVGTAAGLFLLADRLLLG